MFTKDYWYSSASKLRQTKYLAIMGIMIALRIAISFFHIPISNTLHISFGYLVVSIEAMILGPIASMVTGGIADIIQFMIYPQGPFFFGYTLTAMAGGFIYGLFFYRTKVPFWKILLAKLCINIFVNILMGSLWSSMLYSKGYVYYATRSLIKNATLLPIEVIALYVLFKVLLPYLLKRKLISED